MPYPVVSPFQPSRMASLACLVLGAGLLGGCASSDRALRTPDVAAAIRAELPPVPPAAPAGKPTAVPSRE
jgi:MSHA biogenesis protein MshL